MVKKPRENRVPVMMSDAELAQIDDWRFGNRVATRSDAVRRLCQMALSLDKELTPIYASIKDVSSIMGEMLDKTSRLTSDFDSLTQKDIADIISSQAIANISLARHNLLMRNITATAYNYKNSEDIDDNIEKATEINRFFKQQIERMNNILRDYSEIKKKLT